VDLSKLESGFEQAGKGNSMDFIETFFGISPDNGSGLTEITFVFVFLAAASLAYGLIAHRKRRYRG
jgi:hypothetical protein